jgi:hypothetical protein
MIAISATGPEHVMDLSRLKYFAWIADLGSFSRHRNCSPSHNRHSAAMAPI